MLTILELIGNTPIVEVKRLGAAPCRLFLKLENQNPGGSIKDRIALSMIGAAESEGRIKPGDLLVEATAGNTGLGLALVAAQKGYRLLLVIPDKMSQEKIFHLKAMGAEVVMTRSDVSKGHPEYYRDVAERLAREIPGSCFVNQFGNPANALAHEQTTAPEIWEQMGHELHAVVCGAGTGGTLAGLTHFFARVAPHVQLVLADPVGSGLASFATTGKLPAKMTSWMVEGIGGDSVPPVADFSRVGRSPPPAAPSRHRSLRPSRKSSSRGACRWWRSSPAPSPPGRPAPAARAAPPARRNASAPQACRRCQ